MQALSRIPKVLTRVEDLRYQGNIEYAFEEYKKNVRIFVDNVQREVATLIDKYERTIADLRAENQRLKGHSPSKQFIRTRPSVFSSTQAATSQPPRQNQQVGNVMSMRNTVKKNQYPSARDRSLEQLRLSPIFQKISEDQSQINPEAMPFEKQASRFEVKNKRKRHRQQQLRYFLQSGNKSMNFTTEKFIQAIGGGKPINQDPQIQVNTNHNDQQKKSEESQTAMNKSLGDICNSLDTSYISKKARSQKKKRSGQIQNEIELKKKQDAITAQMLRKRGIKSLLERLRENVEASPKAKVSLITASRLFTNSKQRLEQSNVSPTNTRKNSKVMINPIPIDIEKKSKATRKQNSGSSSPLQKKPQSILKQSTVLTKSISGISAIEFDL